MRVDAIMGFGLDVFFRASCSPLGSVPFFCGDGSAGLLVSGPYAGFELCVGFC